MHFFVWLCIFLGIFFFIYKFFLSGSSAEGGAVEKEFLSTGFAAKETFPWLTSKVTFIPKIPQYAVDEAVTYRTDFLTKNAEIASDLTLAFNYDKSGDSCLEATVVLKEGAAWKFDQNWVWKKWNGSKDKVGNFNYKTTQRNLDGGQFRIEDRRRDRGFAEIESIILKIAKEYDYDFLAADNIGVKYRDDTVKKATSDGYADAVVEAFANHSLVHHVEKYSDGKYSWNTIVLKNEKKLYVDAALYDGIKIDGEGYAVSTPARTAACLTFDQNEFNTIGGSIDTATGTMLRFHFLLDDQKKVN